MKCLRFAFIVVVVSVAAFTASAQEKKVENGLLIGGGIGFPMQDSRQLMPPTDNLQYDHNLKGNAMIGYRFRFLPQCKSFFDLDLTIGLQGMGTRKYSPFYNGGSDGNLSGGGGDIKSTEFIMPISVTASWNYHITEKFHFGLGVAPTLYTLPQVVFDLPVLARLGYRINNHCELSLSCQYGCLDVLKHFNKGAAKGRRGHFSDLMMSVYIPF